MNALDIVYSFPGLVPAEMSLDHLDNDDWEPAPGEHPTWSMDEIENHPLFMTEMTGDGSNPHIEALQSVMFDDDTPEGIALNFKDQGNDALRRGFVEHAETYYRHGIATECKDDELMSQLHSNLALVLLKQKKFPECVDECYRAIGRSLSNTKAFYRGALASLELELCSQGLYFARGGLEADPENEQLKSVLASLEALRERQQASREKVAEPSATKLKFRWRD